MSINIRTDFMQHAELFGNPVLFTNWLIQRDTIPKDWYCYDLRGTRSPQRKDCPGGQNRQVSCRHGTLPHPP